MGQGQGGPATPQPRSARQAPPGPLRQLQRLVFVHYHQVVLFDLEKWLATELEHSLTL